MPTLERQNSMAAPLMVARLGRMWRGDYGGQKLQQAEAAKSTEAAAKSTRSFELPESSKSLAARVSFVFFFKEKFLLVRALYEVLNSVFANGLLFKPNDCRP